MGDEAILRILYEISKFEVLISRNYMKKQISVYLNKYLLFLGLFLHY